VKASVGHVKDLPKSKLGIDLENNFEPTYEVIADKKKVISELKKSAKNVDNIFLASDPDREGEAIAWHVASEIGGNKNIYRVLFNDLTKKPSPQPSGTPWNLTSINMSPSRPGGFLTGSLDIRSARYSGRRCNVG